MIEYGNLSLAQQVYDMIEENILSGKYPAGKDISESSLSLELGVGRASVREAIERLSREKLVEYGENGAIVRGITREDLIDFFVIKRTVETCASKMAAARISKDGLKHLNEILEQQEYYAEKNNIAKVIDLDTEFHNLIYNESGSVVFDGILSTIHNKLKKYRLASLENESRVFESIGEHAEIYRALCAGDEKETESLVLRHIENAYKSMTGGK